MTLIQILVVSVVTPCGINGKFQLFEEHHSLPSSFQTRKLWEHVPFELRNLPIRVNGVAIQANMKIPK